MQSRRLGGVAVLAVAVLVLSIGSALARPDVVGSANAPAVDPPPQVGDCLYAGPDGPWAVSVSDGQYRENPYAHWFAACRDPWYAEVVAVRSREDITARLGEPSDDPRPNDPCATGSSDYVGRPDYLDPAGRWQPFGPWSTTLTPNRRQYAADQMWEACVMPPPNWTADGAAVLHIDDQPDPRTTESLRGAWADAGFRDRTGFCQDDRGGPDALPAFCGSPHGSEVLAWTVWPGPGWGFDASSRPDASTLLTTCAAQAARMVQRTDPTAGDALTVDVRLSNGGGALEIRPGVDVPDDGSAECSIHPTSPDRQLTATLVGLGEGPVPLTSG